MRKILILGGSGLVGKAINRELEKNSNYAVYTTYLNNLVNTTNSYKLDIEDTDSFNSILSSVTPDIIISCLRGDFQKQLLLHIKAAEYLKKNDGLLYFCSTTNVFDNDLSRPHFEDDTTNAQTDYGQYKAECEKKIIEILRDNAIILRLPQVWGKDCPRLKNLLKSLNSNEKITVSPKLFLNTITDEMIARKLSYIIEHNMRGIFHLVSEDVLNHKGFYCDLISALGYTNPEISDDYEDEGQFVLLSKRSGEFPEDLIFTGESVIKAITKE